MEIKISPGNSKIGKIPNLSLIPISDCGNCSYCRDKCYAIKAYRMYPGVRKAWGINSRAFRNSPVDSVLQVYEYLTKHNSPYFRIHVAGDFLNQEHLDAWITMCTLRIGTQFMVNTKMFHLDYSAIPTNMHLRFSMWSEQPIPDSSLPKAWLDDGTDKRIPKIAIECSGSCDTCLVCYTTSQDVVFKIH